MQNLSTPITGLPAGALISVTLAMVVAGVLHLLLHHGTRERYLLYWGIAWLAFAARYVPVILAGTLDNRSPLNLLGALRDLLLVLGASAYLERRWARAWVPLFLAEVATIAAGMLAHPVIGGVLAVARLLIAASAMGLVAVALVTAQRTAPAARRLSAVGYGCVALALGLLPMLGAAQVPYLGLLLNLGVVLVPLGLAMAELEQASRLRLAALAEMEGMMTSAIRGKAGVCEDCGRVESAKGEWRTPEEFIRRATTAPVTHGICPACTERMLAELPAAPDGRPWT